MPADGRLHRRAFELVEVRVLGELRAAWAIPPGFGRRLGPRRAGCRSGRSPPTTVADGRPTPAASDGRRLDGQRPQHRPGASPLTSISRLDPSSHLVPDLESVAAVGHVVEPEAAVGPADGEVGRRADDDVTPACGCGRRRRPGARPACPPRNRPVAPAGHALVERDAGRQDVDVVRLVVVVGESDRLAEPGSPGPSARTAGHAGSRAPGDRPAARRGPYRPDLPSSGSSDHHGRADRGRAGRRHLDPARRPRRPSTLTAMSVKWTRARRPHRDSRAWASHPRAGTRRRAGRLQLRFNLNGRIVVDGGLASSKEIVRTDRPGMRRLKTSTGRRSAVSPIRVGRRHDPPRPPGGARPPAGRPRGPGLEPGRRLHAVLGLSLAGGVSCWPRPSTRDAGRVSRPWRSAAGSGWPGSSASRGACGSGSPTTTRRP